MTSGGANNQFDELTYGKTRYIIPLSKYKKKVKYTNPEDICKDGGLVKKILKPRDDKYQHVDDYDYVLVKYEARLDDGTLVRKSDDDGVEFKLNNGHFCPALSIAVRTMKIGEKVILTVKPQYGFGDKGRPAHHDEASVPPNATLQITLSFSRKEKELTYRPNEGALVKLKLIGKLQDGTVFLNKGYNDGDDDEADLFEFKTDEEQVIDGLDKAVLTMKKGESLSRNWQWFLLIQPYYEVELVSFVKAKEVSDMNTEEKIEAAREK
ncbi:FKBP-type peptidyl-prolyl cis-trans isomerase [Medicago truncatula]|uniref:peptidylprolyl isomerase n=1 Tax=Medicago truncatula TaxID=3880 RepID=G7LDI4_MEDTR|nr:FKBP-type peptidyl-prolyl cis-trans isomerase [Medicago truncatula]